LQSENPKLGVNIDHVATLRQIRGTDYPNVLDAALLAERGGADFITVHLREDRRHIQEEDVFELQRKVDTHLNLELAATEEMQRIALEVAPAAVCVVPERREELTTEGGLDAFANRDLLEDFCGELIRHNLKVSLFIEPNVRQIEAAAEIGVPAIELHTGKYATLVKEDKEKELRTLVEAATFGRELGLQINAGHGLDFDNVAPIGALSLLSEVNVGHSIVCKAIEIGLESAVRLMKNRLKG